MKKKLFKTKTHKKTNELVLANTEHPIDETQVIQFIEKTYSQIRQQRFRLTLRNECIVPSSKDNE
jgi:hypothetical protein